MANDLHHCHELMTRAGVMPVVTVKDIEQGLAIARALSAGGLKVIEITLRSPTALDAVRAIKRELPALQVGVGTVCNAEQVAAAEAVGADFLVSPGSTPRLAEAMRASRLPALPGVATPSEAMALRDLGFHCLKLFPAAALGGVARLKALAGPLPDLHFCPTGGIGENDALDYLRQSNVCCVGGSWMLNPKWLEQGDYDAVQRGAAAARRIVEQARA